ncbi:MAG: UDP-N-acetylmuramoyl-L-alanyl-D-glutamate--2,6-diaminopimelate ligase [Alphaproteobacteria bacterium PRO2]|nr:UDP-N-acetylmuramoyl-L-alanyl-D-glutamate--2,6-diaminopimelate ligase [Alphaproteobacteria bacterium PRO2]
MIRFDVKKLKGLTQDSRAVKRGFLFAALPGSKMDGRKFIEDAIQNGASAVLAPTGAMLPEGASGVELITDDNPRRKLALLAAEFYGAQPGFIAAVTGTNGKTSTVHFARDLWKLRGLKAASIGTLGVRMDDAVRSGSLTTPDPVSLQAELADLAAVKVTHLVMEASSIGLHQHRLDGVQVKAAAYTNLSWDHIDYHADMDNYFEAKARLFAEILDKSGTAVLNADTPEFAKLKKLAEKRGCDVISYGHAGEDIRIVSAEPAPGGNQLKLEIFGKPHDVLFPIVGAFQTMNALCALGIVLAENPDDPEATNFYVQALSKLQGPPGRLQLVPGHAKGAAVYVDYAHTPDALKNILEALRPHTNGKLVCVFGCGGDRDRSKRPAMGEIASKLAHAVIITDDNPRSENPASIRKEILKAAPGAKDIGNRREAIQEAVKNLDAGDVLVIAGKGHEQGQIFEDRTEPFDDVTEAAKAIKELKA